MINGFNYRLMQACGHTTIKELAHMIDVPATTVGQWINNSHMPRIEYIPKICKALNVSANWLLGITDDEQL